MAKLFWVEDQSHWIDRFSTVLENADLDGAPNHLEIFKFPEAAKQRIALMSDEHKPDLALLDAHMNGSDQAGFSVSGPYTKNGPTYPSFICQNTVAPRSKSKPSPKPMPRILLPNTNATLKPYCVGALRRR